MKINKLNFNTSDKGGCYTVREFTQSGLESEVAHVRNCSNLLFL